MEHAHSGEHRHDHAELSAINRRRLLIVIVFGVAVLVAEVIGGLMANSLVLLSDAAHMSTDIAAVLLAFGAAVLSTRPATSSKTYGYARAEVVAAFVNAIALWAIAAYFLYESWQRLRAPPEVDAAIVIGVGLLSLVANLTMAGVLHKGSGHNINVRTAYVHVLSDALGSVAAVVAGVGILLFDARWLDPAATLAIAALIIMWTWRLTRETLHILLQGTPTRFSSEDVREAIVAVPGVLDVHDLHLWTLTTGRDNLSAHVVVDDPGQGPTVVRQIRDRLLAQYRLGHVTIEVEGRDADCPGCHF